MTVLPRDIIFVPSVTVPNFTVTNFYFWKIVEHASLLKRAYCGSPSYNQNWPTADISILLSFEDRQNVTKLYHITSCASKLKGIIRVSKLQGIDLFYYLLDLRELANSNDMHKSLADAYFERNSRLNFAKIVLGCAKPVLRSRVLPNSMVYRSRKVPH